MPMQMCVSSGVSPESLNRLQLECACITYIALTIVLFLCSLCQSRSLDSALNSDQQDVTYPW